MFMQYIHKTLSCSIYDNMFTQHGNAAWICSMNMQHGDMDMKHGKAAGTCSLDMQPGNAAWTFSLGLQQELAAWTCSIERSTDSSMGVKH
jgi:hypothetical protein